MSNYKLKYSGEKIDEILTKADGMSEVVPATGETAGKVKLSDATDSESDASAGVAATPKAVKAAFDAASAAGEVAGDLSTKVEENTTAITENATAVDKLEKDIDNLSSSKISKFYASSQGNTNLPDSDNGKIIDLKLYGKGSQQQYSGKNLLSALDVSTSTKLGVTVKSAGAGEISVKGTATADALFDYWGQEISVPKGARVLCKVLQGTGSANNTITFFGANYTNGISTKFGDVSSSTAGTDYKCVLVRIGIKSGETVDCTIGLSLQMDASTDYEPYVGGIPSPNPEYPQEIKSVVKPVVKVCGKNLISETPGYGSWLNRVYEVTGEYFLSGVCLTSGDGAIDWNIRGTKADGSVVNLALDQVNSGEQIIKIFDVSAYTKISLSSYSNNSTNKIENYCAYFSDDNTYKYQPYTEQTATLPYTLNAIPVSSGGNVTIDGQQYIADYVDVERGKLVKKVLTINASDVAWELDSGWSGEGYYTYSTKSGFSEQLYFNSSVASAISNAFIAKSRSDYANSLRNVIMLAGSEVYIEFIGTDKSTLQEWTNYIETNPVMIFAALKNPTETDLTADEIAAFKALVSYYPVTNVSTTSEKLDGYTVFNYPISLANGWNYVKKQIGDTRDYLYDIDLVTAEAYVSSAYATALAEMEI